MSAEPSLLPFALPSHPSRGSPADATGIKSHSREGARLFAVAEFRRRKLKSITVTLIGRDRGRGVEKEGDATDIFREAVEWKKTFRYAGAASTFLEAI